MAKTLPRRYPAASSSGFSPGLIVAVGISLAAHAYLASLHFGFPDPGKSIASPLALDVVLVNSKSRKKPSKADVLAQANLEGGGNVDDDRRAKTPLPVSKQLEQGDELEHVRRRQQELETRQNQLQNTSGQQEQQKRELLTNNKNKKTVAVSPGKTDTPVETHAPQLSGTELRDAALLTIPLEAQVNRNMEEYNKKPRRKYVGTNAEEVRYAMYMDSWRQKIEDVGTRNYPDSARGRIYGSLRVTVIIKADGTVRSIQIDKSSGHSVLDRAAEKIVTLAAPFAQFPADIRREYDELVIVRTWTFAPGDKVFSD